jgi:acetyl esterase/lipase
MMERAAVHCVVMCAFTAVMLHAQAASAHQFFANLTYESPGGWDNRLDLYLPDGGANPDFPTILYIHGGAWASGDKSAQANLHIEMANYGYSVVSCNYTLSTHVSPSYPQVMFDVKAVVRWIRTTGVNDYGISPAILTTGASAGGHLAMMLGVTDGMQEFEPLDPPPGGYAIDAVISTFGPTDLVALADYLGVNHPWFVALFGQGYNQQSDPLYRAFSPLTHVSSDDPPMGYFQGMSDPLVPFQQALWMDHEMDSLSLPSLLFLYQGGHEISSLGGDAGVAARLKQLIPALLAGDDADNAPMYAWARTFGTHLSGVQHDLYEDDDHSVVLRSQFGFTAQEPQIAGFLGRFHGEDDPRQAIHVLLRARLNQPGGKATLRVFNHSSGLWEQLGQFQIGQSEIEIALANLPAVNRISEPAGLVWADVRFSTLVTFSALGFRALSDQFEVRIH